MSSLQPFDVTEHIREKVRKVILDSIPADQIDSMIKHEFDRFFSERNQYGQSIQLPFAKLVETLIYDEMKKRILVWMEANLQQVWSDESGTILIGEMVDKFVPIVQHRLAHDLAARVLQEIRNAMR